MESLSLCSRSKRAVPCDQHAVTRAGYIGAHILHVANRRRSKSHLGATAGEREAQNVRKPTTPRSRIHLRSKELGRMVLYLDTEPTRCGLSRDGRLGQGRVIGTRAKPESVTDRCG